MRRLVCSLVHECDEKHRVQCHNSAYYVFNYVGSCCWRFDVCQINSTLLTLLICFLWSVRSLRCAYNKKNNLDLERLFLLDIKSESFVPFRLSFYLILGHCCCANVWDECCERRNKNDNFLIKSVNE